jgi:hypothetical protein
MPSVTEDRPLQISLIASMSILFKVMVKVLSCGGFHSKANEALNETGNNYPGLKYGYVSQVGENTQPGLPG